jgi:dynein heavy chain
MPYTQEATIRTHYRKLKKFIKLIDYFLIDVKLTLISSSTTKVLEKIRECNADL